MVHKTSCDWLLFMSVWWLFLFKNKLQCGPDLILVDTQYLSPNIPTILYIMRKKQYTKWVSENVVFIKQQAKNTPKDLLLAPKLWNVHHERTIHVHICWGTSMRMTSRNSASKVVHILLTQFWSKSNMQVKKF